MYRCEHCLLLVEPGVASHRVPVAVRAREYPPCRERNDRGGSGWEVAREAVVCRACAGRHVAPAPPPRVVAVSPGVIDRLAQRNIAARRDEAA